jgi:Na+/H+-dicarboxylate symporter
MKIKMKLHWQILSGLLAGAVFGIIAATNGLSGFTHDWITPFGTLFVNLLKLIAMPLVFASLVTGVASLSDVSKLSRMGGKTIGIYMLTTVLSITIGLVAVNVLKPGESIPPQVSADLQASYQGEIEGRTETIEQVKNRGPLQPMVDIVPQNIVAALSENIRMLQVVFFALFFGVCLILAPNENTRNVKSLIQGMNDIIIKMVDLIMYVAPIGVFALIAGTITAIAGDNIETVLSLLSSLGFYTLVVIFGLISAFLPDSLSENFLPVLHRPSCLLSRPVPVRQLCRLRWNAWKTTSVLKTRLLHSCCHWVQRSILTVPHFTRQWPRCLLPRPWVWI